MKHLLFQRIRLSWYFFILLSIYLILAFILPKTTFDSGHLTLFSVNSFLYGFYLAPLLSGQKTRIDELHKIVRDEANSIFSMMIHVKKLPDALRNELQAEMAQYIATVLREKKIGQGEKEYEAMISDCLKYTGPHQKTVNKLLEELVDNQENRTQFSMQMTNRVFNHEWMVITVLFSITIGFILLLDVGNGLIFPIITALLCAGLTMLHVILAKFSSLTHKRAKEIWNPYEKLIDTHFYRVD